MPACSGGGLPVPMWGGPRSPQIQGKDHVKPPVTPQVLSCRALTASLQGEKGRLRPKPPLSRFPGCAGQGQSLDADPRPLGCGPAQPAYGSWVQRGNAANPPI